MENNDLGNALHALLDYTTKQLEVKEDFEKEFDSLWQSLLKSLTKEEMAKVKKNFVKELVPVVIDGCIISAQKKGVKAEPADLGYGKILAYVVQYHLFYTGDLSDSERADKQKSKNYRDMLINELANDIVLRGIKFFNSAISYYSPIIVKCELCCSLIAYYLEPYYRNDGKITVFDVKTALFGRALRLVKNILNALTDGIANDAAGIWRTLYEIECVIIVLNGNGAEVTKKYFDLGKYYEFEMAKADGTENDEKFADLKKSLEAERAPYRSFGNETAFISYGWLSAIPDFGKDKKDRFDFGTLERYAGQSDNHKAYVTASKSAHSGAFAISTRQEGWFGFVISQLVDTIFELFKQLRILYCGYNKLPEDFDEQVDVYTGQLHDCYFAYLNKQKR